MGCVGGGADGVLAGAAAAGGADAGPDAGDETEADLGAHAAATIPTASVAKTSGLTIQAPFAKKKKDEVYCGGRFSRVSSIFCMRSISVD